MIAITRKSNLIINCSTVKKRSFMATGDHVYFKKLPLIKLNKAGFAFFAVFFSVSALETGKFSIWPFTFCLFALKVLCCMQFQQRNVTVLRLVECTV